MTSYNDSRTMLLLLAAVAAGLIGTCIPAAAQTVSLNYDRLSSLEEPLATEIGDVTLLLNGLVDTPMSLNLENDGAADGGVVGNFQASASTQLPNRWRVNLAYFGQYTDDPELTVDMNDNFKDNLALSIGGVWGTVLGGNISGVVREQTRRLRGAGNAFLAFDDVFGKLDDWGGGYLGRFGPWVLGGVVDEEANFDLGAMFQRPLGNRDYRFTARYSEGVYTSADGSSQFNTRAVGVVGELVYGSALFDIGAGYERFSAQGPDVEQWYISSGVRMKLGVLTWSLEGQYGQIESADKKAVAVGIQYDLARGLSANFGLNHENAKADIGYISFIDAKDTKAIFSLRYSF